LTGSRVHSVRGFLKPEVIDHPAYVFQQQGGTGGQGRLRTGCNPDRASGTFQFQRQDPHQVKLLFVINLVAGQHTDTIAFHEQAAGNAVGAGLDDIHRQAERRGFAGFFK